MRNKHPILLALIIVAFALPIYKLLLVDRLGFCASSLRFTSGHALILKQIGVLMKSGLMKLDPTDTSPEAYLARHPNCCRADWGDGQPFDRGLTAFGSATITVNYELSKIGRERYGVSSKTSYYELLVNYTACGKALDEVGGG